MPDSEMTVTRVHTDRGSHIEPPLDQAWGDLTKLRWHVAVVSYDTGLDVQVKPASVEAKIGGKWTPLPGMYAVLISGTTASSGAPLGETWAFLNGVRAGAEAARTAGPVDDGRAGEP